MSFVRNASNLSCCLPLITGCARLLVTGAAHFVRSLARIRLIDIVRRLAREPR
jgi:hypothetical protein